MATNWFCQYLVIVLIAFHGCTIAISDPVSIIKKRQAKTLPLLPNHQNPTDAWDHSWISEWTAIGDSYSSGLGCGSRTNWWCSQYDHAFPNLINHDVSLGTENRKFTFLACLSYTTQNVIDSQISTIKDPQDIITVTAGGNDVFFSELVSICIYSYTSWDHDQYISCEKIIRDSQAMIASDELLNNLKAMFRAAQGKLKDHGLAAVYAVLYPRFFDDTTDQCDKVSWSTWLAWPSYDYLTQERRKTFNSMVDALNGRIREAAAAFDGDVITVGWQDKIDMVDGKFCEPGVDETVGKGDNREQVIFYEWYSTLDDEYFKSNPKDLSSSPGKVKSSATDPANPFAPDAALKTPPVVGNINVTLDKAPKDQMNPYLAQLVNNFTKEFEKNETALKLAIANDPDIPRDATALQAAVVWGDKTTRVFHPQYYGHQQMAYAVLSAMEDLQAKVILHKDHAPTATYGCPAPTDQTSFVGVLERCHEATDKGIYAFRNEDATAHIEAFCSDNAGRTVLGGPGITRGYDSSDGSDIIQFHVERKYDGDCKQYTGGQKSILTEFDCSEAFKRLLEKCSDSPDDKRYGGVWDAACIAHDIRAFPRPIPKNSNHKDPGVMCRSDYDTYKQGDWAHFMTVADMTDAINQFCNNLAFDKTRVDPGGETSMAVGKGATGIISWPDPKCSNPVFSWIDYGLMGSAERVKECIQHLGIVRDDCDVKPNGFLHYKQGGNQTYQCVTYGIGMGLPQ